MSFASASGLRCRLAFHRGLAALISPWPQLACACLPCLASGGRELIGLGNWRFSERGNRGRGCPRRRPARRWRADARWDRARGIWAAGWQQWTSAARLHELVKQETCRCWQRAVVLVLAQPARVLAQWALPAEA